MSELPRKLGLPDGALLLIGSVIGSAIFVVPSLMARRVPEPGLVIGIWVFSGLLVLAGALALAELGAMLPHSGGLYVYMREAYGRFFAFLYGWTVILVVIPGSMAALTAAFLLYLGHFLPLPEPAAKVLGIVVLLALAFVNSRGVRWGANVQNGFTILKAGSLLALVAAAVITQRGSVTNLLPLAPEKLDFDVFSAIGVAMISTLFAYDGWHFVGFVAGEMKDPARNVPRSILIGIFTMIAIYAAVNVAYLLRPRPGGHRRFRSRRFGRRCRRSSAPVGASLIALAIMCSTFGANAANMLAGPRVLFAMARDGLVYQKLAEIHPRFESPANAIWFLACWAAILTLTGGYEHLITMAMFANWMLFAMIACSVVVLRRRHPEWARPYRVPFYPFPVAIFVLVALVFVLNTLVEEPAELHHGIGDSGGRGDLLFRPAA